MAKLTTAARSKLRSSTFAGPHRSFPIPDRGHAKAALSLVGRALKHGSINSEQAAHIRARAHAKLGSGMADGGSVRADAGDPGEQYKFGGKNKLGSVGAKRPKGYKYGGYVGGKSSLRSMC